MKHWHRWFLLGMLALAAQGGAEERRSLAVVTLDKQSIAIIKPGGATTREAFERDWGQFEVRIPKQRFPIPAPHCRKNVIFRMPGVVPSAPDREKQLAASWQQFQSMHQLAAGMLEQVEVAIASGPYMRRDRRGRPVLQYCNAYMAISP